jgi:hypothetical protein
MLSEQSRRRLAKATNYNLIDSKYKLMNGLYIMVGGSGQGKTLAAWSLAESVEQPVDAMMINESHAPYYPLDWILSFLEPEEGLFHDYANIMSKAADLGDAQADRHRAYRSDELPASVILFDSATAWLWAAERVEYERKFDSANVSLGRSATKTGGLSGELIDFLMMADRCCVRMNKCVIWTINIIQYPVGSSKDVKNTKKIFDLFKGITSGVMLPWLVEGGQSAIEVSDRSNRDGRRIRLQTNVINRVAYDLGLTSEKKKSEQKHRVEAQSSLSTLKTGRII